MDSGGTLLAVTHYSSNILWRPDLTMDCYRYTVRFVPSEGDCMVGYYYSLQVEVNPSK